MITSIHEFKEIWREESNFTRRAIAELTDASLLQPVTDDHRTLGRISWHVIASIPDTMCRTLTPGAIACPDGTVLYPAENPQFL